ncbi:MAG: hypothetical protein WD232_10490 [Acidimicrobiales bacterium]
MAPSYGASRCRLRACFEATIAAHASRVVGITDPTDEELCNLTADDVAAAAERI